MNKGYRDNAKLDIPYVPLRAYLAGYTRCPFCGHKDQHMWVDHDPKKCGETRSHTHRWCRNCKAPWVQGAYEDTSWLKRRRQGLTTWWGTSTAASILRSKDLYVFLFFVAVCVAAMVFVYLHVEALQEGQP